MLLMKCGRAIINARVPYFPTAGCNARRLSLCDTEATSAPLPNVLGIYRGNSRGISNSENVSAAAMITLLTAEANQFARSRMCGRLCYRLAGPMGEPSPAQYIGTGMQEKTYMGQ